MTNNDAMSAARRTQLARDAVELLTRAGREGATDMALIQLRITQPRVAEIVEQLREENARLKRVIESDRSTVASGGEIPLEDAQVWAEEAQKLGQKYLLRIAELEAALKEIASSPVINDRAYMDMDVTSRFAFRLAKSREIATAALSGSSSALDAYTISVRKEVYLKLGALLFPDQTPAYWESYWDEDCPADPEDGMNDALAAHDRNVAEAIARDKRRKKALK